MNVFLFSHVSMDKAYKLRLLIFNFTNSGIHVTLIFFTSNGRSLLLPQSTPKPVCRVDKDFLNIKQKSHFKMQFADTMITFYRMIYTRTSFF